MSFGIDDPQEAFEAKILQELDRLRTQVDVAIERFHAIEKLVASDRDNVWCRHALIVAQETRRQMQAAARAALNDGG